MRMEEIIDPDNEELNPELSEEDQELYCAFSFTKGGSGTVRISLSPEVGTFLSRISLHVCSVPVWWCAVVVVCGGQFWETQTAAIKKSSTFTSPHDGLCPLCKAKGQSQVLKTYRINFTQSIFLCSEPQCIYPLGYTPLDNIITNTPDLKNLCPSKQIKRSFSELSPPSQPNMKRLKSDLPLLGQYSPINAATSAKAESSTSAQSVPPWEHDTPPSEISQCGWTEDIEVTKLNVPETADLFSSTPVLNRFCDRLLQSEDDRIIDKSYSTNDASKSSNTVSETGDLEEKELKKPGPSPLPEMKKKLNPDNKITLNGSPGILEDSELSSESVLFSKSKDLSTGLLQNRLCSQMKDSKVSPTLCNGESAMPVSLSSLGDVELAQSCDVIQKTLQDFSESRVSHLLQCTDNVLQNTVATEDGSCAEDKQHRGLSIPCEFTEDSQSTSFESKVFTVLEQDKSGENLNKTSLKSVSQHHVEAAAEENKNNPVVALEPVFHLPQDSCEMISASYSLHDFQPPCLSDNGSVDVCEPLCSMASVMKAIEELTAAPLKVCPLSVSLQLEEGTEKMHVETTSSHLVEDIQPECSLEVDSSLNLLGTSCMTDAAVVSSKVVSPEGASLSESHLSDQADIMGDCQQNGSETATTFALLQETLPECQSQKCLNYVPLTPCATPSSPIEENSPCVASAEIIIPNTLKSERLDRIYSCQKSVCNGITPLDSPPVTRSVHEDSSLIGICNTVCSVPEKEDSSAEKEITPLPDHSLLGTKKLNQDSMEPCAVSTPLRNIQAALIMKDNSVLDVNGSSYNRTSAMDVDDGDNAKIPAPLTNSQLENNASAQTPCSQAEDLVETEACPLHDTVTAIEDFGSGDQDDAPLIDSPESKRTPKKTSFENTLLPDLLLDIQPEHRMEDQLLAVPSPTCDADLMETISADCKQPKGDKLLQARLDKLCVQDTDTNEMEVTNPNVSNDDIQNSIHLSNTSSSEGTLSNESIESGSLDLSVMNAEQSPSDEILEARTFENSQRLLQWKNRKSLCWLDCLLSALVQSRTLSFFVAKHGNDKESLILNLFAKYKEATALCKQITKKKQTGRPTKSETCLNKVRMHIFDTLKPLLKCELGHKESPVFAFPLLLRLDPDFQKLFVHSFTWNFKCESCGYTYQDRCQKTMTTFTKIVPDWRPLNAVHKSPCNKCQAEDQRREMHLETLQPMFMLHFVEGLPSSDLKGFAFEFGEHWYDIRTVIRYRDQHFSTWMANDDGTWLESDDLKGSFCKRHQKFRMRAEDIHIVIWEKSTGKSIWEESSMLSSTTDVSEMKSENQTSIPTAEISLSDSSRESLHVAPEAEEVSKTTCTEHLPQVAPTSESVLSCFSTEHTPPPAVETNPSVLPSALPASRPVTDNPSNLLAGMEGYAEDDIITLTLVEIPLDSTGQPVGSVPLNSGVPQVETNPDDPLQPTAVEMLNGSAKLPQHTGQSKHLPSEPPMPDASPICTSQQMRAQPCRRKVQTSNMPVAAIATSTPNSKTFSSKKSVVDNMMGTLVKNDNFFINSNFSSASRKTTASKPWQPTTLLKESDFNGATKKADSFEGFRGKTVNNIVKTDESSLLISKLLKNSSSFNVPKEKTASPVKTFLAPAPLGPIKPGKNGLSSGKISVKDHGLSGEDKVRKLRLKLLKKLKAKKNELALLEKVAKLQQNGSCPGESNSVQPGVVNRQEHLRGFLQELQEQIDNADNESIGTVSSCTSICSSPGDAEFFAELFSPSPVDNPENDSRFLEMLADGHGISAEHSQQAAGFDYSMNNTITESTSGANTLNQSCSGEQSLNLLSSSTMAVLTEDTGYLDSFDIF
ncbi:SUMO-specific isopeptidase USPL1 [Lithobates pipiens]